MPCREISGKEGDVQKLGLGVEIVAAVLHVVLPIVHLMRAKSGGGGLFERKRGWVRLSIVV